MNPITHDVHEAWIDTLTDHGIPYDDAEAIAVSIGGDPRVMFNTPVTESEVTDSFSTIETVILDVDWDATALEESTEAIADVLLQDLNEHTPYTTSQSVSAPGTPTPDSPDTPGTDGSAGIAQRGFNTESRSEREDSEVSRSEGTAEAHSVQDIRDIIEASELPDRHLSALAAYIDQQLTDEEEPE